MSEQIPLFDQGTVPRKTYKDGVYSAYIGDNAVLIEQVVRLYTKPGDVVVDATWGKGCFWKNVNTDQFDFRPSDIITLPGRAYDFRKLPYEDNSVDVSVLDPPYVHNPGKLIVNANYQNAETTKGFYHDDIAKLYFDGIKEAARIVKPGGTIWIKSQDEIESGYQRWSHVEHLLMGLALGLYGKDLFVLFQDQDPVIQHEQQHARRRHSYLLVLRKPLPGDVKALARYKVAELGQVGVKLVGGASEEKA